MKTALVAALLALTASAASADSLWNYTGNSVNLYSQNPFGTPPPNACNCSLSGSVLLADAFTPISWNFSANGETFTNLNSTLQIELGFDEASPIFTWLVFLQGTDGSWAETKFSGSITDAIDAGSMGLGVGSNEGIWSDPTPTPEPSTLATLLDTFLLFGSILLIARCVADVVMPKERI